MGSEYVHVILNLLAVLILMFGLIYILKKFKMSKYSGNKHINIINVVPIGPKEKIILMEVNNSFLLVGATPNHIETLCVFNELAAIAPTPAKESDAQKPSFLEQLKGVMS